jgi:hypothetical protein
MMRRVRTTVARIVAVVAATAAVAGCYPPSQTPTTQPLPPGGRVIATAPQLTELWIEDVSDDLSTILYRRNDFLISVGDPIPYRYWVWDEAGGRTTEVPVGRAEWGTARLSPDLRSVVFSSNDPRLQVGPTAINCMVRGAPWYPDTYHVCQELYLFDLDTRETRQLTGLDGSSTFGNFYPDFSDDGQSIEYSVGGGRVDTTAGDRRLDLATGQVEVGAPRPPAPTSWDRGTHVVSWDGATGTLTSEDRTTGDVTTLWADPLVFSLASETGNGRFIVLSRWVTDRQEVFRLIDTDTGIIRTVKTPWISEDGSRYAVVQVNVAPDGIDRLVIAPVSP